VRLELRVQLIEHDPGLDHSGASLQIDVEHAAQMLGVVDHQRRAGRLSALTGTCAARKHRHLQVARDLDRQRDILIGAGQQHAHGHDLVDRGIGRVAPARCGVEQHLALRLGAQAARQPLARLVCGSRGARQDHGRMTSAVAR
jgi:hypothetical protein